MVWFIKNRWINRCSLTFQENEPVILHQPQFQQTHSTTTSRPDLVLITGPEITFLELTVPFNSPEALAAARSRKSFKSNYLQLATDLEDSGWSVSYFTLEVGSLGNFEPNATRTLADAFLLSKQEAKQILMKLSRIAVSCSYHIFNARLCSTWDVNKPVCFCFVFLFCLLVLLFFIRYLHILYFACQAHHSSVLVSCCPRLPYLHFILYLLVMYIHVFMHTWMNGISLLLTISTINQSLNDIIITFISSRRYLPVCYILCCSNSISCSHIGYVPCGCNLCSIGAISIICVHFKVFKCNLARNRCVQLC